MKKILLLVIILIFVIESGMYILRGRSMQKVATPSTSPLIPLPSAFNPFPYKIPQVEQKRSYLTYIVGDSIVATLGANVVI